jgi:hypothetical protein
MHIFKELSRREVFRLFRCGALALFTALTAHGSVVINEIHYHPDVTTEPSRFVELYNAGTNSVDLSGWHFSAGIGFLFPSGTSLAPDGYLVVAQAPAFLLAKYSATALGPFTGNLSGSGEKLALRDASRALVDEVDYQLGFPWPTVGDPPGYSIELIDPAMDNNLGGSWRASVRGAGGEAGQTQILIPQGSEWHYRKGTNEASIPREAWRAVDFNDSDWLVGLTPIGYDPSEAMGSRLDDMRSNYACFFARKTFAIQDPSKIGKLMADVKYDDGFNLWINGRHVLRQAVDADEMPINGLANTTREAGAYDTFALPTPLDYLVAGTNEIAVQVHNISLANSSDAFIDLKLYADPKTVFANRGPTPGSRNSVFATNAPPQIRQVEHFPQAPASSQEVRITAKITDPDGVASVTLQYQTVEPGSYIELADAAYRTNWISMPMGDAGTEGDAMATDDVYTAVLPASVQANRRLIRYRITASDALGESITVPYADDPQPNFAYFVYDGVPSWKGAVRPSVTTPIVEVGTNAMRSLPVYHLISKKDTVERSTWKDQYQGNYYNYSGAVVYDGMVYDHIRFRTRGGVWRYAMGKNMWKFDMNRGHDFEPRDNFGKRYDSSWRKINLGACIQQGDYGHRGEQGLFESVGFKLFNLAGIEAPKTHFIHFRVVDQPDEVNATNQYAGDFWGLYLAVEQEDGRFLSEHGLPDGNLYKMDGGTGELNNQGSSAVTDRSDLNRFMSSYRGSPSEAWWRTNLDLTRYYNYRTIVEAIHHYDIDEGAGKNYDYYLNPKTGLWSVHPWDLDLTWANNMYGGGVSPFKNRVLPQASFNLEYRNRIREIRDLLFNTDQTYALIDEFAAMIHDPNGEPSFTDADRAQWDYNPIMASSYVYSSKSGQGLYYRWPNEPSVSKDFHGAVQLMKNYVGVRSAFLDSLSADPAIPGTPVVTSDVSTNFPFNRLLFKTSPFVGNGGVFSALQWRLAEVTPAGVAPFVSKQPRKYEIAADWESGDVAPFNETVLIPSQVVKIGHAYRVRSRMRDVAGRWSHWSAPVQFVAGEPEGGQALKDNLRLTELMCDPTGGSDFEYIELYNASDAIALDLSGATFSKGIDFTFGPGTALEPKGFLLLAKGNVTNNFASCRSYYHIPDAFRMVGPFVGNLDNKGETLALLTGPGGTEIFSFAYGIGAGWPVASDGKSLTRVSLTQDAADPLNWTASEPTPGFITIQTPLRLGLPQPQGDGTMKIQAAYAGAAPLTVEFSTNLLSWNTLGATNAHDGWFEFTITNRLMPESRFYRLKK